MRKSVSEAYLAAAVGSKDGGDSSIASSAGAGGHAAQQECWRWLVYYDMGHAGGFNSVCGRACHVEDVCAKAISMGRHLHDIDLGK